MLASPLPSSGKMLLPRTLRIELTIWLVSDGSEPADDPPFDETALVVRAKQLGAPIFALVRDGALERTRQRLLTLTDETGGAARNLDAPSLRDGVRDGLLWAASLMGELQRTECSLCGRVSSSLRVELDVTQSGVLLARTMQQAKLAAPDLKLPSCEEPPPSNPTPRSAPMTSGTSGTTSGTAVLLGIGLVVVVGLLVVRGNQHGKR